MVQMSNNLPVILVIDDEPGIHKSLYHLLQKDFSIHSALSGEEGIEKANVISPDLVLLDMNMPQMSGMSVLKILVQTRKDIPVIVFTGYGSIDSAVRSIKLGAIDYIEKPFDTQKLKQTVTGILRVKENSQNLSYRQNIVGESPQIQWVWQLIERYGHTDLPILLQGETGTGKELFARAIHDISKRRQEAFAPVDCSTVPETLFESEIFGYAKGAFTGASVGKPGQLDWAHKGTFFLDEISNLPLGYQSKLLRVVQERRYVPLGAKAAKEVDVRFVSSCNIDLKEAVEHGIFREDLYYRISGVCIELPALRKREGDIELLVHHFINKYTKKYDKPCIELSDDAMELLLSYPWPGNVRELEYKMSAAVASADRVILPGHILLKAPKGMGISREREASSRNGNNGDKKVEFELNFSYDITKPIDLKNFKKMIAAEAEVLIINAVKKRLSVNQMELSKFLSIDPKTLRTKSKNKRDWVQDFALKY